MTLESFSSKQTLLDIRNYVQWFDAALPPDFCNQMLANFNKMTSLHTPNGRGYRGALNESSWTELNIQPHVDKAFMGFFYTQIDRYLGEYNARLPMSLSIPSRPRLEDLRIKRYRANIGDQFQPHFDAADAHANRYLVFLWYLNDVNEGGETAFPDLSIKVEARVGRLLMFPPYWMFQHAGLEPISNDKYIVSTYLLF